MYRLLAAENANPSDEWTSNDVLDPLFGLLILAVFVWEIMLVYRQEHAGPAPAPPARRPAV